jgi:hypothetical protein
MEGKGIYVFRSRRVTDSKENDEILYFYNNTGSYRFSVESVEEPKEGGGFYRTNTYIYTEDSKLPVNYGYTLTMVYDLCPSKYVKTEGDAKVEVPYKVVNRVLNKQGNEDENSRTECDYNEVFLYTTEKYDFDLYETKSYKLNVYGDLFVGDFYENKAIYNELRVLLEKAETKKENLGLHWVDTESSEEMDYHTFVLYRRNMEYATLIDVVPSLRNGKLTLMVNYDEREHTGEIKNPTNYGDPGVRPGKRYSLYYVTLEVAKGADVSIAYSVGQTTESELSVGPVTGEFTYEKGDGLIEIATPIDYDVHGMLNTELVKYMAELNDVAVTLLDNCTTMEMLKKRVAYLSLLLNTEKQLSGVNNFPSATDTEAFDKEIDDLIRIKDNASVFYNGNFSELFYQLTHMTNYGTMEEVREGLSKIGGGTTKEADECRPIFYSPYGIYYLWMEAYQYLPANMQTETK